MSQEQPRRPQGNQDDGIRYGDVEGEIASKNIAPRDAATMQAAEARVLGQTQRGDPASVMQSAADFNFRLGVVGRDDASDIIRDKGVTITEGVSDGRRFVSEAVGGEAIGGYASKRNTEFGGIGQEQGQVLGRSPSPPLGGSEITIGEALEAVAIAAGDKPVEASDAAAIKAGEIRATGRGRVTPGGIAAEAEAAANMNPWTSRDQDKIKLGELLGDATGRLPGDKPVTREDADRVVAAEVRSDPCGAAFPGGVAAAVAAAARLNQRLNQNTP